MNKQAVLDLPADVRAAAARVTAIDGDKRREIEVVMNEDARARAISINRGEEHEAKKKGGLTGAVWARAAENITRLSGLLAASDAAYSGKIEGPVPCTMEHVRLAEHIFRRSVRVLMELAAQAGRRRTEMDELMDRVKEYVSERGSATMGDLKAAPLRGHKEGMRGEVVTTLVEIGELVETVELRGRNGQETTVYRLPWRSEGGA